MIIVKKYEIKFSSDGDVSLKKTLKLYEIILVVRSVFNDVKKFYLQLFLNGFFCRLGV